METKTITYRRNELYELVWTEPVTKVAKKYGISSVALAKICKRLSVPLPGSGYWYRLRAGKSPTRSSLPPPPDGEYSTQIDLAFQCKPITSSSEGDQNRSEATLVLTS